PCAPPSTMWSTAPQPWSICWPSCFRSRSERTTHEHRPHDRSARHLPMGGAGIALPGRYRRIMTEKRPLVLVSNRGPVSFEIDSDGEPRARRGAGGLISGLAPLVRGTDT